MIFSTLWRNFTSYFLSIRDTETIYKQIDRKIKRDLKHFVVFLLQTFLKAVWNHISFLFITFLFWRSQSKSWGFATESSKESQKERGKTWRRGRNCWSKTDATLFKHVHSFFYKSVSNIVYKPIRSSAWWLEPILYTCCVYEHHGNLILQTLIMCHKKQT